MTVTPYAASTIAQQACRFIEKSPISSFADDTPLAQAIAEQYPTALKSCLENHDWSFARRLVILPLATLPEGIPADPELPFSYKLPADFVSLRHVQDGAKWRRDENFLRADVTPNLTVRYTRRIEKEDALPATFQTAIAAALAVLLAPEYVGTRTKRETLKNDATDFLAGAVASDKLSASGTQWSGQEGGGEDWAGRALV
ncbi:hypothetical protein [Pseudooceanicola sp.]|uniref:hypothetical protein n=1 Tax=Pseudooceanicola sp. TaxID=1914328 RepID=UPI004058431F